MIEMYIYPKCTLLLNNAKDVISQFKILTFNLPDRTEVLFKSIIEFRICDGFKITGVNSSSRSGKTTFAHTGVIS